MGGGQSSLPLLLLGTPIAQAARLENTVFDKLPYELAAISESTDPIVKRQRDELDSKITSVSAQITAFEGKIASYIAKDKINLSPIIASDQAALDALKSEKTALEQKLDALGPSDKREAIQDSIKVQQYILSQSAFDLTKENVSRALLPAIPNVVENTTSIPTGCIYDIDNDGNLDSTYVGTYVYNTRSYTETVNFIDNIGPPARTILEKAPDVIISTTDVNVSTVPVTLTVVSAFCVDSPGNIYTINSNTKSITMLSKSGDNYTMNTFAGGTTAGSDNGTGIAAKFREITDICVWAGNIYAMDSTSDGNNIIRQITPGGVVSNFGPTIQKGTSSSSYRRFEIDSNGNCFVSNANCIRKISSTGGISLFAGSESSSSTSADGTGTAAKFKGITRMCIGSNDILYVVDSTRIRKIMPDATVSTYFIYDDRGKPVTFSTITGLSVDSNGDLYISGSGRGAAYNIIKLIDVPDTRFLITSIFAGNGTYGFSDGRATSATFGFPSLMTFDPNENMYVFDSGNNKIRKITVTITRRTDLVA